MIWNSAIDFLFSFLNSLFHGFGFFDENVFHSLSDILSNTISVIDSLRVIVQPYMEFVFFFIPVNYIAPIFLIIAVFFLVRLVVAILKTIMEVIPVI